MRSRSRAFAGFGTQRTAIELRLAARRYRRSGAMICGVPVDGEAGVTPGGDAVAVPVVLDPDELLPIDPVVPPLLS